MLRDPEGNPRPYVLTILIEDKTNTLNQPIPSGAWENQRANILRSVSERVYRYIYNSYGGKLPIR